MKKIRFKILYKAQTSKGSNYFKLYVEYAHGIWEDAVYFGSTVPKEITGLKPYGDGWIAEIQSHVSRDQKTGQFKGKRKEVA